MIGRFAQTIRNLHVNNKIKFKNVQYQNVEVLLARSQRSLIIKVFDL